MVLTAESAEPLKRCSKCGESKPLTEFHRVIANGFPEGFQTLCRVCNLNKSAGPRCTLSHLAEAEAQALVRKLVAEGHSITQIKKISGATLSQVREWRAQELERRSGGGYTEVC